MNRIRRALLGLMFVGLAPASASAAPWPEECKLALAATLPMTIVRGKIMVPVDINDHPYNFAIDTGGFATAINDVVVEAQKIPTYTINAHMKITDVGGAKAQRYARVETLTLGRLRAESQPMIVEDAGIGNDGHISPDVLQKFDVELDFTNKTINLFHPHRCSDHAVYWTDDYATLPMEVMEGGHIQVDVTLNDKVQRAMIDTGAPSNFINVDDAKSEYGMNPDFSGRAMHGSFGGTVDAVPMTFEKLVIGSSMLIQPHVMVTAEHAWRHGTDMVLGLDTLSKFHVLIAYHQRKLYLSPVQNETPR